MNLSRILLISLFFLLGGCSAARYAALEKVGVYKRDILVDRVEDAQQAQEKAKEKVVSAYEEFTKLVKVNGGDLEATYKRLNKTVKKTEKSAREVDKRIAAIDKVAKDMFDEWRDELKQYSSATLRKSSAEKLRDTQRRYQRMITSMRRARERIDPVLHVFQDHVLFLKHNLNARALAALKSEVGSIEGKVDRLIEEMEKAIAEADAFIKTMP